MIEVIIAWAEGRVCAGSEHATEKSNEVSAALRRRKEARRPSESYCMSKVLSNPEGQDKGYLWVLSTGALYVVTLVYCTREP